MCKILEERKIESLDCYKDQMNGCTLKYVDRGLAFRSQNIIFLNKNLRKHVVLHDDCLMHELSHSSATLNFKDLFLDFKPRAFNLDWWRFMFKYPGALWQFSPLIKLDGKWRFNVILLIYYFILLVFILYIPVKIISLWS